MSTLRRAVACCAFALGSAAAAPAAAENALEAVTPAGDRVILHPNGRWEYADPAKANEAKRIAERYPENRLRPADAQGGLFGLGRTVLPGDPDYNRGSLNPKTR